MFRCCSLETSHPLCVGLYSCFGLSWKKFPGKHWRVHWKVLVFINSTILISSFCWFKMPVKNTPTASAQRSSQCLLLPFPRVGLHFRAHVVSPEHPLGMYPAPAWENGSKEKVQSLPSWRWCPLYDPGCWPSEAELVGTPHALKVPPCSCGESSKERMIR